MGNWDLRASSMSSGSSSNPTTTGPSSSASSSSSSAGAVGLPAAAAWACSSLEVSTSDGLGPRSFPST
eukprot:CAMPEP_0202906030 /NCGR_PEP_ID=MMETSP1392-20130828/37088_1 /ASSEMBLY_ACC=CAM_ASM_000868 /TAXON_ID=225041 /ORGANISM="Chlamydomonas chlamydogama, Strain SAG 11-48b" /LENGTH=67 /DNA_ID=CAMNT_0049594375 /DNA_START=154 /DNA_END=357 /DNA_ORIENTATION=+